MGKRGPKPLPSAILARLGSYRAAGRAACEVNFGGDPEPPEWLEGAALKLWRRVVPQLKKVGVTADVDSESLAAMCVCWQEIVEASAKIKDHGMFVKGKAGPIISPAVKARASAIERFTRLAGSFGFTPSDRSRIGAGNGQESIEEENDTPKIEDFVKLPGAKS